MSEPREAPKDRQQRKQSEIAALTPAGSVRPVGSLEYPRAARYASVVRPPTTALYPCRCRWSETTERIEPVATTDSQERS